MTSSAIKKQVDNFLPLLTDKQQGLVLELIKSFLNVNDQPNRISAAQYNKEIDEAVARIDNGTSTSHEEALKALSKW